MKREVLTELSLELLVEHGKAMGMMAPASRDGAWAYNACKLSRLIVGEVEERWPPTDYVETEVLEAFLREFPAKVQEVGDTGRAGDWANYLPNFVSNIKGRVVRLENYVENPPFVRV